jgi:enoyl-[acyl-carrier protein] reductase I
MLTNKTALVVGVLNRFSLAWGIAEALHAAGARLLITYQGERTQRSVERLAETLPNCTTAALDVLDERQVDAVFEQAEREFGGIDILMHAVAYAPAECLSRPFVETGRADFTATLEVSAYSLVALTRKAVPQMAARGGGSVLTLTYLGGERVVPNYNVMGVAKAALEASVRYLAYDLGPQNIRVNAISAGPVSTAAARGIAGFLTMAHHVAENAPLHRGTEPSEVGDTAAFLCSDAARGITGEIIHVDSGYSIMGTTVSAQS